MFSASNVHQNRVALPLEFEIEKIVTLSSGQPCSVVRFGVREYTKLIEKYTSSRCKMYGVKSTSAKVFISQCYVENQNTGKYVEKF